MIASIQELLQKEAQAVLNIPVTDAYERAVELIVEQVHRKKGKLVTSGMGKAGQIAMNIATTFCSTGTHTSCGFPVLRHTLDSCARGLSGFPVMTMNFSPGFRLCASCVSSTISRVLPELEISSNKSFS